MSKEKKMTEKENHKISLNKYTKGGKASCLIALLSLLIIIASVVISILLKGKAGVYIGALILVALIISIIGFSIGLKSFEEESKFLKFTYIGTICNAVVWLFVIGMYLAFV